MNIFITGCTSGIGKETVLALAKENHQFFLANRSAEKTNELIKTMQSINTQVQAQAIIVELSSLLSVKKAALDFLQRHQTLDILINNAGVFGQKGLTQDGYEMAFGTNFLAHFFLTHLLQPALSRANNPRIINVASDAHWSAQFTSWDQLRRKTKSLTAFDEYGFSKLANIWHTNEIATQIQYQGIQAYSLHPGVVKTGIWRHIPKPLNYFGAMPFLKTAQEGAKTTLFCLKTNDQFPNGQYFSDCRPAQTSALAQNQQLQKELWNYSLQAIKSI